MIESIKYTDAFVSLMRTTESLKKLVLAGVSWDSSTEVVRQRFAEALSGNTTYQRRNVSTYRLRAFPTRARATAHSVFLPYLLVAQI